MILFLTHANISTIFLKKIIYKMANISGLLQYLTNGTKIVNLFPFIIKLTLTLMIRWILVAIPVTVLLCLFAAFRLDSSGWLENLLKQFSNFYQKNSTDRLYVHIDKPLYKPGETIWLQAYIRNEDNLQASNQSDIVYIELINPKGSIEQKINLIGKNGVAQGDFQLSDGIAGGIYKIKAYTNHQLNFSNALLFEKEITVQQVILPRLNMQLDFLRKAYGAGDIANAKLQLNTLTNQPLANYTFSYTALLNGAVITQKQAKTDAQGKAIVSVELPKKLNSNDGLLNIIIDYEGRTESISRSIPIVLNNINIAFFPEGGDLVAGIPAQVGFIATNEFDKPADISGEVLDEKGKVITTFSSYHMGMGAFALLPQNNQKYSVKITKPEGITTTYNLPEILEKGYALSAQVPQKKAVQITVHSWQNETLRLIAQVRGKVYFSKEFQSKKGANNIEMPLADFPTGVAQITLFDSKGYERAERLIFVNKHALMNIEIKTDKEQYQPREKVTLHITTKNEEGMGVPAQLSLAVIDSKLRSFADDKQGNILSKMLLEPDLNGYSVEEPNFYFDKKETKADSALHYLLMTRGWRHFTWKQIMNNEKIDITYEAEKAVVKGRLLLPDGKPAANIKVTENQFKTIVTTNPNGEFTFSNLMLYEPTTIQAEYPALNNPTFEIKKYSNAIQDFYLKRRIKGKITDTKGNALPYTAVTIKGTRAGTQTDKDGNYVFEVPKEFGQDEITLLFRYTGKKYKEIKVKYQQVLNVELEEDPNFQRPVPMADMEVAAAPNARNKKAIRQEMVMDDMAADRMLEEEDENEVFFGANDVLEDAVPIEEQIIIAPPKRNADVKQGARVPQPQPKEEEKVIAEIPTYYRAREFPAPTYKQGEIIKERSDFRTTVHWQGNITTDKNGKSTVTFFNNDEISSFTATVEGISERGEVGYGTHQYFTQLPFSMSVKAPVAVTAGDVVYIPLTLKNNTDRVLDGVFTIQHPKGWIPAAAFKNELKLKAGEVKTLSFAYRIENEMGKSEIAIRFAADERSDAFRQEVFTQSKGFPAATSFSGREPKKDFTLNLTKPIAGSITAHFTAFPSIVSELLEGVESLLQEPYGCFEQTSSSTYPNIIVLQYLREIEDKGKYANALASAEQLVEKGYNRLVQYETKQNGYEWFGGTPAHESLTAYGLLEFTDMQKIYSKVNPQMLQRTTDFLLKRKDGRGGFLLDSKALDDFGRCSPEVANAYIVYALSEAGIKNIEKEAEVTYQQAITANDAYLLALTTLTHFNLKQDKKAQEALKKLVALQEKDGSFMGKTHSVTRSTHNNLAVETTSLSILAMLRSTNQAGNSIEKSVQWVVNQRKYGRFGATQATILALKALTEYTKFAKQTNESGTIVLSINGKKVAEKSYQAGEKEKIDITDWAKHLKEGKQTITVEYKDVKNALPYTIDIQWASNQPESHSETAVDLQVKLDQQKVKLGNTVRMTTTLQNKKAEGLPMTIAIVSLPGGVTAQPWQLKEWQDKKVFDFYETKEDKIIFYFRQMKPNEQKIIHLDLKTELKGTYEAQASAAYLYYTDEFKAWVKPQSLVITD
jgi:hypothetical protein